MITILLKKHDFAQNLVFAKFRMTQIDCASSPNSRVQEVNCEMETISVGVDSTLLQIWNFCDAECNVFCVA